MGGKRHGLGEEKMEMDREGFKETTQKGFENGLKAVMWGIMEVECVFLLPPKRTKCRHMWA